MVGELKVNFSAYGLELPGRKVNKLKCHLGHESMPIFLTLQSCIALSQVSFVYANLLLYIITR